MNILGISCYYHDAAAALLKGGCIVAAAQEERFTRVKHDAGFPINAIVFCLKTGNITIDEVDAIAFYDKPLLKFERLLYQHLEGFPWSFWSFYKAMPSWCTEKLRVLNTIKKRLKYRKNVLFCEHHLSHAASAFFCSPFERAAILTVDGVGEWATTTLGYGDGARMVMLKELNFPHSLGLLYSTFTSYLGFTVNNAEYKVMGLAAYGTPTYGEKFKKLVDIKEDGSYRLDMSYFDYHYKMRMPGKKLIQEFGLSRSSESPMSKRFEDIAASLQKVTEECVFKMLNELYKETKVEAVCLAGGVALNSVVNGKILRNTPFKQVYIQPAASDAGCAVGAALFAYHQIFGNKRTYVMDSAYLGPEYTDTEIQRFLDDKGIKYGIFSSDKELVCATANAVEQNKVVGWFQGRMEWGPRALGARSILANPCSSQMKDILNLKVKHREKFRPFAPVIMVEKTREWFDADNPVPLPTDFMLMVYDIWKEKQSQIPAVVHVDGTGRLQTIREYQNPLYYGVIKEFEKATGVPIVVNTSFNIRGEPIVCSPQEAYRCMMGTGIDCLVMGRFLIKREDNSKDVWDSEKLAKD